MELMLSIIGGSCGAALVAGVFGLLQWRLTRKAQKEDRSLDKQIADCDARGDQIQKLEKMIDVLILADRTILYDRIKHLGKSYIARGWITVEELEDLKRMHQVYHDEDKLNGNGFLDTLMNTINTQLEIR